ncbi:MAG: right-handed parallel beta-helix repeat-containing protein [Candidatus Thermoplasmatota archaeon]|nr:right-handed parallel beta-helix repeat-containing protein [Candidatus Thermoplasmatota archaeon]
MTGTIKKVIPLALVFMLAASIVNVDGEENSPDLLPGGGYETAGDWTIQAGDDINWSAATIIVSGNLTVESGGVLALDNVELIMNSTIDGGYTINIEPGGRLRMTNGRISSGNPLYHYNMTLGGEVFMESVQISEVWGDPEEYWEHGISLTSDQITINDCNFLNCAGAVLHVLDSDPIITNCRFYHNGGMAAIFDGHSSPLFKDNLVYRQTFGIFVAYYASPLLDGNTLYDLADVGITFNGIRIPKAVNNTIHDCPIGMLLWYSNAYLEGNDVFNCETGIQIMVDSNPEIISCMLYDNDMSGIVMNGSRATMEDTILQGNMFDGIKIFNGSNLELIDCSILNNKDDGLQLADSFAKLSDCTLTGNKGDTIYARDEGSVELFRTDISGDQDEADERELKMEGGSDIEAYDSTFDESSVSFGDPRSRLTVKRWVQFLVKDPDGIPVPDLSIRVVNGTGYEKVLGTNLEGEGSRYFDLYRQFDLNSDGDGDDAGEVRILEYNFSIEENGYLPYEARTIMDIGYVHNVVLEPEPVVSVIFSSPGDGDREVPVDITILIRFDRNVDPTSLRIDIEGPGGKPVFFELEYFDRNRTARLVLEDDLSYSSLYKLILREVEGDAGEVFSGPFRFQFTTVSKPLPDNDLDGIPDMDDDDDDNDGFNDIEEEYYGTDPFNDQDFPLIPGDDDDDDELPDIPVVPGDDDVTFPDVIITPVDDNGIQPTVPDDNLDPVTRTDDTAREDDGGGSIIVLIFSGLLGFLILAGTVVLIFLSGRKQSTFKEDGP